MTVLLDLAVERLEPGQRVEVPNGHCVGLRAELGHALRAGGVGGTRGRAERHEKQRDRGEEHRARGVQRLVRDFTTLASLSLPFEPPPSRWTLPSARLACEIMLSAPDEPLHPRAGRFATLQAGFHTIKKLRNCEDLLTKLFVTCSRSSNNHEITLIAPRCAWR